MKTRTAKSAKPIQPGSNSSSSHPILEQDPLRLLLLPQSSGPDARICTLLHPSTSKPCRYYWCPKNGLYEFQKVAVPRKACRSWLLAPKAREKARDAITGNVSSTFLETVETSATEAVNGTIQESHVDGSSNQPINPSQGYTIKDPEIFIATPIDILFIVLPSLYAQISKNSKALFLSVDDLLENALEESKDLKYILGHETVRPTVEARMAAVCDSVDAGDEMMYRLNMDKLVRELVAKAKRMSSNDLPASMEAKFIDKALEVPMMSLKREASSASQAASDVATTADSQSTAAGGSQPSTATNESVDSRVSFTTDVTIPDQQPHTAVSDNIKGLLRLRTALNFTISSYLAPTLASLIQTNLSIASSPVDFKPLEAYLVHLANLRAEVLASRTLSNFSRKRSMDEDDEAAEAKAEKRRKKEEEEKRQKMGLTKGVRDLKKADITGMKKMSDFFGKKSTVTKES
ncbi:MAG: hypothetical protein Q9182_005813 [Xanthomendoza sp. 2 TL-2023]